MCSATCTSVHQVYIWCPRKEEGVGSLGTGVRNGYEPPYGHWELNLDPLWDEQMLLTAEPNLEPPFISYTSFHTNIHASISPIHGLFCYSIFSLRSIFCNKNIFYTYILYIQGCVHIHTFSHLWVYLNHSIQVHRLSLKFWVSIQSDEFM